VSFGNIIGCEKNYPSVMTRVTSHLAWIDEHKDGGPSNEENSNTTIYIIVGSVLGGIVLISIGGFVIYKIRSDY
jgi:hypothetical protein